MLVILAKRKDYREQNKQKSAAKAVNRQGYQPNPKLSPDFLVSNLPHIMDTSDCKQLYTLIFYPNLLRYEFHKFQLFTSHSSELLLK